MREEMELELEERMREGVLENERPQLSPSNSPTTIFEEEPIIESQGQIHCSMCNGDWFKICPQLLPFAITRNHNLGQEFKGIL